MKTIPEIKSDYLNNIIDYETAKNQLYLYSKTAQSEIEDVMVLWKLKKDKPEVNNLLDELAILKSKNCLVVEETATLMTILRMTFDKTSDIKICKTIISISKKLELSDFFINEMESDLKTML